MNNSHSNQTLTHSGLGVEELFKAAFIRTKERFLTYFLTYVVSIFIFIGVLIATLLLGGINFVLWNSTQSVGITASLVFLSIIVSIGGLIYVGAWTSLAYLYALVSPNKLGVIDVYKSVKPLVLPYFKVTVITSLFMIGLLPFGILSIGIIFFLWNVWGMFMLFVFLDKKETGLNNIFISKAIVSTKFWGVVFRVFILYGAYFTAFFILGSIHPKEGVSITQMLIPVLSIVAGPFFTSYLYEIYKNLPYPKEVKSNRTWVITSIIGWVLMVALIIFSFTSIVKGIQKAVESPELEKGILQMKDQKMNESTVEKEMKYVEKDIEELMETTPSNEY